MSRSDPATPARLPRLLWVSPRCLLDTSSPAAIRARQLLQQLARLGWEVEILGATVFGRPEGRLSLQASWAAVVAQRGGWVTINEAALSHRVHVTRDTQRLQMGSDESLSLFNAFVSTCERLRPDLVLCEATGEVLDMLLSAEARRLGSKVVALLGDQVPAGQRWCRDVDLILTECPEVAASCLERDNLTVRAVAFAAPLTASASGEPVAAEPAVELLATLRPLLLSQGVDCAIPERDARPVRFSSPPVVEASRPRQRLLLNSLIGGPTSMGRVGEALLRHLQACPGIEARLLPFKQDPMLGRWPEWIARCVDYRPERRMFDQQIKFCSVREAHQRRLAHEVTPWFFHDVDGLPASCVQALNSNDRVYACSHFVASVFKRHGVTVPVEVLGLGFDPEVYRYVPRARGEWFTFLCVAEHTARKNLPMLIRAFERAFAATPGVRLRLKTGVHDASQLRSLIRDPERVWLDTRLRAGDAEMAQLYQEADCFVLPTRLEGFGMPILEAMATGLPVIVTDYSGHLDFCNADNAWLIRSKGLVAADTRCFPHLPGLWSEPCEEHLIELMRGAVADYEATQARGLRGWQHVQDGWTWTAQLGRVFAPQA